MELFSTLMFWNILVSLVRVPFVNFLKLSLTNDRLVYRIYSLKGEFFMYGDNINTVSKTIRLDSKRRIKLPLETGAVLSGKVVFMHDLYCTKISLYNEIDLHIKLNEVVDKILILRREGRIDYKTSLKYQRYVFGTLCYPYEIVDKERRIVVPDRSLRVINADSSLYVVGNDNHLDLFKDEETYLKMKHI